MKLKGIIESNISILKLAMYAITLIIVFLKGPEYYPDSYAHMEMLINRSVLYSIIINIPKVLTGAYSGYMMILIHFISFVLSVEYFLKQSKKVLSFSNVAHLLLIGVFCFLALFVYPFISSILSEGIAFPLLLFCVGLLIELWQNISLKHLIYFAICFFLLMMTRAQFIIILPVFLIFFIVKFRSFQISKLSLIIVVVIISIPLLTKLTEKYYYHLVLNENIGYTMTFVHLISAPFYVSSIDNQSLFTNKEERSFFTRTKRLLDDKNLSYNYAKENDLDELDYYQNNFTKICNAAIHEANMDFYQENGVSFYNQHRKVDEITKTLFFPLLKQNFVKWSVIVYKSFKKGLGRSHGILVLAVIIVLSILCYKHGLKELSVFFLGILILKLSLHLLIAISVHSIPRYLFYFQWLTPMFLVVVGDSLINNKKQS